MQKIQSSVDKLLKKNFVGDNRPKLTVEVTRPRAEVTDTESWQVETIRSAKSGVLGDIAVAGKRERPFGRPTALYDIHTENDEAYVAYKPYPDLHREGWTNIDSLGSGKRVAIGFEGNFEQYRGRWRFVTENEPLVFWTNQNNELYFKRANTFGTPVKLDENIVSMSCCQAWRNDSVGRNEGFLLAYIKTDQLFIRVFKEGVWSNPKLELIGEIKDVQLALTNDYRVAIMLTMKSNALKLVLTDRMWTGMALRSHSVEADCSANVKITKIEKRSSPLHQSINVNSKAIITTGEPLQNPQVISCRYPQFEFDTVMIEFNSKIETVKYMSPNEIISVEADGKGDLKPKKIFIQEEHLFCTCEKAFEDEEGYITVTIPNKQIFTKNSAGNRFYYEGGIFKFKRGLSGAATFHSTSIVSNVATNVSVSSIFTTVAEAASAIESTVKTTVQILKFEDNQV